MANNPILDRAKASIPEPWPAMKYYRIAVENGDRVKAALWLAEAKARGEIVDPSEQRPNTVEIINPSEARHGE